MGRFTVIPQSTFEEMQLDAGVLLNTFDPNNVAAPADSAIICATTGGINITATPTYSDLGEDVDNCPVNMKELKHLDSWEVTFSFTALGTSPEAIKLALGAADVTGSKVAPRRDLEQTDFGTIWWVGDRADGGLVAVKLDNALSTGGFSLQTTKSGKGQISVTLTGHVSINAQNVMPMEFYSFEGNSGLPYISLNKHTTRLTVNGTETLVASVYPAGSSVTWTSASTATATVANGLVTGKAAGNTIVTAAITVSGVTYNDTCTIIVSAS